MSELHEELFRASPDIRYVAVYVNDRLQSAARPNLRNGTAAESDRYEELLVNPTVITLVGQRGRIDCGGLDFVLIRYGNFYQLVMPVPAGHVSVAIEPEANPLALLDIVRAAVAR